LETVRFWVLVCYADTQIALQLHQERLLVVRSTKVVCRIPIEPNGTPGMDLGLGNDHVRMYHFMFV